MKKITILILILISVMSSCVRSVSERFEEMKTLPVSMYLSANSQDYSHWVELLNYTNYYYTFNLSKSKYTCFVPTNAAVKQYLDSKNLASVRDLDIDLAKLIVKYHTIAGASFKQSSFSNGVLPDTTASGDELTVQLKGIDKRYYVNGYARITRLDIEVVNGCIHEINQLLIPITDNMAQRIESTSRYSIYSEMLKRAGLYEKLDSLSGIDADGKSWRYSFTSFVVPDSVYKVAGINSVEGLENYLYSLSTNSYPKDSVLYIYARYHTLDRSQSYTQLAADLVNGKNRNIATMANGELINIGVSPMIEINHKVGETIPVKILSQNNTVKNGLIHEVDGIMPIVTPPASLFEMEVTDFTEIASAVGRWFQGVPKGVIKGTSGDYAANKEHIRPIAADQVKNTFVWETVPGGKFDAVNYIIPRADKSGAEYKQLARNVDYLHLSLGNNGWIEFKTPTIVGGTYKLRLYHVNMASSVPAGLITVYVDDEPMQQVALRGNNVSEGTYIAVELGEVTFLKNTSHYIRIVQNDGGTIYPDYLQFDPK